MTVKERHPIADLPFVADRAPRSKSDRRRCFWNVTPTGDYMVDRRTGAEYALAYLRYRATAEVSSLPSIVLDMPHEPDHKGIQVGFLALIDYAATYGVGAAEDLVADRKQRREEEAAKKKQKLRTKLRLVQGGLGEARP
jgi:hypothetical protein